MSITTEYLPHWKNLGCVLMFQSPDFQYHSDVVICEFEGCLINKISTNGLYHKINPKSVEPFDHEFIKQLRAESFDKSIIIISNQLSSSKLIIDITKQKLEAFIKMYNIPILALFALQANKFSKPHTGMWNLLTKYYKEVGRTVLQKACIVSNFGGRIMETVKKTGAVKTKYDNSDIDRAFANNINIPYYTILEYRFPEKKEKFIWSSNYIDPELRVLYLEKLAQYKNPNIFSKVASMGEANAYMIIIYGAPRSGKTTVSRSIIRKWRNSEYGKKNEIHRLGLDNFTNSKRLTTCKKYLIDYISVIIDGGCHTDKLRAPFEKIALDYNIPVVYVEVNPGIGMAYLFNHTAVEAATKEDVYLYPEKDYFIYKSMVRRPPDTLLYCPEIKKTDALMLYRY